MLIRPLQGGAEAAACAELMAASEPWRTLGRGVAASLTIVSDPAKEVYVGEDARGLAGFLILDMHGPFIGYIQTVCVAPDRRGQGLGTTFVQWAEARIRRDSPNVFLCVSSFNDAARRLYERLGYEFVGTLSNYLVDGHDEHLLRKSVGSWSAFRQGRTP